MRTTDFEGQGQRNTGHFSNNIVFKHVIGFPCQLKKIVPFLLKLCFALVFQYDAFADSPVYSGTITLDIQTTGTTCNKPNGRIIVMATGGTAPYQYSWNGNVPQVDGKFVHLPAGVYNIQVIDALGNTAKAIVTLTNTHDAPTGVTHQAVRPSDCTSSDASLTLNGMGGTPPYTYSIDQTNYQASNYFPRLTAGQYYLGVMDANGCTSPQIWYEYTTINEDCTIHGNGLNLGYICGPFRSNLGLYVSGGKPPYSYSLDGIHFQSNYLFEKLPAGLYTVTVKDADNTLLLYKAALVDRCLPIPSLTTIVTPASCGVKNGTITVTAADGLPPYEYAIDAAHFQSGNVFQDLASGNYTITVRDADNSQSTILAIVGENSCITLSSQVQNSTCGNSNGSVVLNATDGKAPYQYSMDGIQYKTDNQFNGLNAGTYIVFVKDGDGTVQQTSIVLKDIAGPSILSLDSVTTGCDNKSGAITVNATSSTAPIAYSLDGTTFQREPRFTGLSAGVYNITVKSDIGCIASASTTVEYTNTLSVDAGSNVVICQGTSVQLKATSNGGVLSWSPNKGLDQPTSRTPIAQPGLTTKYYLTATQGPCSRTDSVMVTVNPAPVPNAGADVAICFGKSVPLNGSGGSFYYWSPSTYLTNASTANPTVQQPSQTIRYALRVIGQNGCTSIKTDTVLVTVTPPAKVFAGHDTSLASGQTLPLAAVDMNNSRFNEYSWSPSWGLSNPYISNPLASPDKDISYVLTATAPGGCKGRDTISIKVFRQPDIYVPTAFTPNNDGLNDVLKAIPVGIAQFKYFRVYDRWGGLVFQSSDLAKGWNGKAKVDEKGTGTYVWMAAGVDYGGKAILRKGTVVLSK